MARLFLFVGYPGAGKTTIATILQNVTHATHLCADSERHKLFTYPTHSEGESVALYDLLNARAAELLASGKDVLFDTNFNYRADRDRLRAIAQASGAETIVIWVTTPRDVARQRAVHDQMKRNGYSYLMTADQFDSIADKLEPPDASEPMIKINGTTIDEPAIRAILSEV